MQSSHRKLPPDEESKITAKILSVLEYFGQESADRPGISFHEVSMALPFGKATVHRVVYTLEKLGYLEKVGSGIGYRLGPRFFALTSTPVPVQRLRAVAKEIMLDLLIRYSETVCIGFIDEGEALRANVDETSALD
jgi:DNA-binding IclR family transcriptional regulator